MNWQTQRLCTDVGDYELIVEQQKTEWKCEQKRESWKWNVIFHGTIVASGFVPNIDEAKKSAEANVPQNTKPDKDDCGCD